MQNVSAVRSARIGEEIETIKMAIGFQGIVNQNTDKTETQTGFLLCGAIPLPHDGTAGISAHTAGGKPEHRHQTSPRKRALVMREIPLYLLPAALQRGVKENGGKLYRVVIVRTHWHHYTIKIRCSTKKAVEQVDLVQHTDQSRQTDKVQQTNQSRQTDQTNTTGSSNRGGGT